MYQSYDIEMPFNQSYKECKQLLEQTVPEAHLQVLKIDKQNKIVVISVTGRAFEHERLTEYALFKG